VRNFNAAAFTEPISQLQATEFDPPDLLLAEVVMPQLSGLDLTIHVRQGCSSCKVIWFYGLASIVASVRERGL
jgi:FixJ family two-component response regulator